MHNPTHNRDKRADTPSVMKRAKPNRLRQVQVIPPHNVELTLPPDAIADIRVPAHINGSDLSKGGPQTARFAKPVRDRH